MILQHAVGRQPRRSLGSTGSGDPLKGAQGQQQAAKPPTADPNHGSHALPLDLRTRVRRAQRDRSHPRRWHGAFTVATNYLVLPLKFFALNALSLAPESFH